MKPKFRAWDKTENLMSDVREISFFDKYVKLESGAFRGFDEVALMQSTGLTDKHTVEVYQGDIVWDDMDEEYGVVRIEEAKTIIEWDIYVEDLFEKIELLEVVGNIYENKKLLKEER
ncbi:YopX family protein [Staphylococcus phage vB_SpsS_QT1]|uniref:YopX protein n=1 Tax=Staphylococcus phage vB_SpsS_QT1 TaxID=2510452 RepID=A0A4P6R4H7_9CAUD|nr:YopX family protein [Staphylococcus phage vB_SpsS_QT1]QBJ05155.1 YopX protein [Staphylococcus phage vB_SpsS_QT1]